MTVIRPRTACAVVLASLLLQASPLALAQAPSLDPERLQQELRRALAERDRIAALAGEQEQAALRLREEFGRVRSELEQRIALARDELRRV
ncbi:MAG: hypothetical protein WHV64_12680, partial [Geminicoccaceae bacterium]